jgi:hypothetical protein
MKQLSTALAILCSGLFLAACKDAPAPASDTTMPPGMGMPTGHPDAGLGNLPTPPSGEITGEIRVADAVKDKVGVGDTIFVMARNAATGSLIAVIKVQVGPTFPVPFKLTGGDIMHSQTSLAGKVRVEARVDKDNDAMTKNPGDVVGETKELVSIPASGVVVVLENTL